MDNFRDSYFNVNWDLTTNYLSGTYWGKQYDTGRGFAITVINGGLVVTPTNEVLRLKWEKPDNTTGYVNATIINGKFVIENIDQMFTVAGSVRADFELSVGGKFVASITFNVNVEKAVAVDAVVSHSQLTALQTAIATVDGLDVQMTSLQEGFDTFTGNILNTPSTIYVSDIHPPNPSEGDLWFKIVASVPEIPVGGYLYRFDASELQLNDGAKVAQWDDMSANGYHVTQPNANLQPIYLAEGLNGKPTVKFDGSILSKTSFTLDNVTKNTMFLVMSVDVVGTSMGLIMGITKSGLISYGLRYSGAGARIELRILGTQTAYEPVAKNESAIIATTLNDLTYSSWKNGIFNRTGTTTMRIGDHDALQLGYNDCKVRISEAIQYSRVLSDTEIDSVNAYLRQKWGI